MHPVWCSYVTVKQSLHLIEVLEGQSEVRGSVRGRELEGYSQQHGQLMGTPLMPLKRCTELSLWPTSFLLGLHY